MHFIFLLILAGVAWWGLLQSKKGVAWGRNLTAAAAVCASVLAIIQLIPDNPSPEQMEGRVDGFAYAAGVGLGLHLGEAYPEARVRVLTRSRGHGVYPAALADGLEKELRGKAKSVERVLVSRSKRLAKDSEEEVAEEVASTEAGTPLRDALQGLEGNIDVLVWLFPPPPPLLRSWAKDPEGKPQLAVAVMDVSPLLAALEAEQINVVLAQRPNVRMHKNDGSLMEPPSDPTKAFSHFFEILTPETVGAFKTSHPHLVL